MGRALPVSLLLMLKSNMDFQKSARRLLKCCSDFVGLLGLMLESGRAMWFLRADFVARSCLHCLKIPHPTRAIAKS
jgi:hypothetical protein